MGQMFLLVTPFSVSGNVYEIVKIPAGAVVLGEEESLG